MVFNNCVLSLIICTYNRAQILQDCLYSLVQQTASASSYKVLIINNNSSDNTQEIINNFTQKHSNFTSILEPKQGLSHARNRGFKEVQTEWIAYIDDDVKVHENYVKRALWTIENHSFDCFGGMQYGWFKFGQPKWLKSNFGTRSMLLRKVGILSQGMLSGGNMLMKTSILEAVGGFDTNLGMNGNNVAYGEDDYLILKLREKGYTIGFDPELKIDHLVMPHKLSVWWHISSWYAMGKANQRLHPLPFKTIIYQTVKSLLSIFIRKIPINTCQWLFSSTYYWQNLVLDTCQVLALRLGHLKYYFEAIR